MLIEAIYFIWAIDNHQLIGCENCTAVKSVKSVEAAVKPIFKPDT